MCDGDLRKVIVSFLCGDYVALASFLSKHKDPYSSETISEYVEAHISVMSALAMGEFPKDKLKDLCASLCAGHADILRLYCSMWSCVAFIIVHLAVLDDADEFDNNGGFLNRAACISAILKDVVISIDKDIPFDGVTIKAGKYETPMFTAMLFGIARAAPEVVQTFASHVSSFADEQKRIVNFAYKSRINTANSCKENIASVEREWKYAVEQPPRPQAESPRLTRCDSASVVVPIKEETLCELAVSKCDSGGDWFRRDHRDVPSSRLPHPSRKFVSDCASESNRASSRGRDCDHECDRQKNWRNVSFRFPYSFTRTCRSRQYDMRRK